MSTRMIELQIAALRSMLPRVMMVLAHPHLAAFAMDEAARLDIVRGITDDQGEQVFLIEFVTSILRDAFELYERALLSQQQDEQPKRPDLTLIHGAQP